MIPETIALTVRDLKRWLRTPVQILVALITPLFWLLLFGQAFNIGRLIPAGTPGVDFRGIFGGAPDYFSFMAVGQLAMIVLFTTFFGGVSLIWDRKFGFLSKLQVAPIHRIVIPLSRISSTVVRCMIQAAIVIALAVAFVYIPGLNGLKFATDFGPVELLGMVLVLVLLSVGFSAVFVALGLAVRSQETFFGLINMVNMPLMFTSNALIPIRLMPDWLAAIAKYNPLTFAVDALRQLAFRTSDGATHPLAVDLLGITIFSLAMIVIGGLVTRRALVRR
jgi:ABC-2 type transport system permease protein